MASTLFDIVVITSLLTSLPLLCTGTSDPMTSLCGSICWEEEALAEQCAQDRCSAMRSRSRAYRRCQDACFELGVPCRTMCSQHAMAVLETCDRKCAAKAAASDTDCSWNCFTHNMMTIKARLLPSDYLGFRPKA